MPKNLSSVLRDAYSTCPDQTAIILHAGGAPDQIISYRDLLDGSAAYAHAYSSHGLQPGDVVVLILQPGRDLINAFWGAILYGAIPSIMPFLTEKLLPERYRADLASLVAITQPDAIVTYPEFETTVRAALKPGDSVREVLLSSQVEWSRPLNSTELKGLERQPDDVVLLQHSSGTTGLQKGVALSHQAVFNQLEAYRNAIALREEDVIVSWLPLYHDMGLIAGFLQPVLMRVPLVMMSPFEWVKAPYKLMQLVSQYHGTLTWMPNFAFNFCAQKIRDRHLQGIDLSSWRAIINCSEPVRAESHEAFFDRFKPFGLKYEALYTSYAMAENVFGVTQSGIGAPVVIDTIERDAFQNDRIARRCDPDDSIPYLRMLSCGKPIQNTRVKILGKDGQVLADRTVGEIAIQSDCMLTEYFKRPDETSKAFLDGWYLTGDYGYTAEGEVFVSGRKKDLIIVGGKNVYPQDLERLSMEVEGVHPGRVVAFGVFNDEAGTEEVVIVAEVDTQDPDEISRISDQIRNQVTRGSAVSPRTVYLVDSHWLIKTSSGKTARLANRDKYLREMQNQ
jgi:acyl-CoA synthetase (AMP-forming)/AMP-acid ligase II